jgi:hypothetical protein
MTWNVHMLRWKMMTWKSLIGKFWTNDVSTRGIFFPMVWCHMAQAWAATWHPICLVMVVV